MLESSWYSYFEKCLAVSRGVEGMRVLWLDVCPGQPQACVPSVYMQECPQSIVHSSPKLETTKASIKSRMVNEIMVEPYSGEYYIAMKMNGL